MQWRLIDDNALRFRFWEEECAVYNALSGDTHLIDRSAAQILKTLQGMSSDVLSLARLLAPGWQCDVSDDLLHEIEMVLSELQALSLVENG